MYMNLNFVIDFFVLIFVVLILDFYLLFGFENLIVNKF